MDANRTAPGSGLKSELARFCLPAASRDTNRTLAWANSICILFLLIGIAGARSAAIQIKRPPPLEEVIPTVVEPLSPPPPTTPQPLQPQEQNDEKPNLPQVVAVTMNTPNINFSVPTVGNLVVPAQLAVAPPASTKAVEALKEVPLTLQQTGTGGNLPTPPYPELAFQLGQQGSVVLLIAVDEKGQILSINIKQSAGPILDRSCTDFVRRHWIFPSGPAGRVYEQPFVYSLLPKIN
jgi:TonB family protein